MKNSPCCCFIQKMSTIEAWIITLRRVNLHTDYDRGGGNLEWEIVNNFPSSNKKEIFQLLFVSNSPLEKEFFHHNLTIIAFSASKWKRGEQSGIIESEGIESEEKIIKYDKNKKKWNIISTVATSRVFEHRGFVDINGDDS